MKEESLKEELSKEELIDQLILLEWKAFDKVENEGGRADCQNNFLTFQVMRRSQYLTWTEELLSSFIQDFLEANERGWNLITEKYGRMMESTAPEEFESVRQTLLPMLENENQRQWLTEKTEPLCR